MIIVYIVIQLCIVLSMNAIQFNLPGLRYGPAQAQKGKIFDTLGLQWTFWTFSLLKTIFWSLHIDWLSDGHRNFCILA